MGIWFFLFWCTQCIPRGPELRTNCGYHWKNNIDDEVEDDTIPLKPVMRKKTLTSRTLHKFMESVWSLSSFANASMAPAKLERRRISSPQSTSTSLILPKAIVRWFFCKI
ncbi:hypothetical protein H5410_043458 [Solanum commersonii]|uniref:Secreted protein n=1 Tax=Solanum commersonii TaxID=4109 RepID=A0A9J5Y0C0_SOLCO|nr:hypothetical protein H5410_043458 [Solanum commersonii]